MTRWSEMVSRSRPTIQPGIWQSVTAGAAGSGAGGGGAGAASVGDGLELGVGVSLGDGVGVALADGLALLVGAVLMAGVAVVSPLLDQGLTMISTTAARMLKMTAAAAATRSARRSMGHTLADLGIDHVTDAKQMSSTGGGGALHTYLGS
ncbi:MAG TPA: hypothetical protein PLZ92_09155 [Phycicoccus sp.]|nr:hypothetical protein [Phycicoccus sp.]